MKFQVRKRRYGWAVHEVSGDVPVYLGSVKQRGDGWVAALGWVPGWTQATLDEELGPFETREQAIDALRQRASRGENPMRWGKFSNPLSRSRCAAPTWRTTPEQVARTRESWSGVGKLRERAVRLPISGVSFIDFDDPDTSDLDVKGGRRHVTDLARLMRACEPLPPAVGYYWPRGSRDIENLVIHDGNHRLTAARQLYLKDFPILIYEPTPRG